MWLAAGAATVAIVGGLLTIPSQVKSLLAESSADASTAPAEEARQVGPGWGPQRTMYTVRSPSPTAALNSIKDNPSYGDTRNFTRCRNMDRDYNKFVDAVAVTGSSQIEVIVLLENASVRPGEDIAQTSMHAFIQETPSDDPVIYVELTGRTTTTREYIKIWDGCQVMSDKPIKLSYLPGSGKVVTNDRPDEVPVDDEIIRGTALIPGSEGRPDGYVHASTSSYGFFTFTVLAVPI